MTDPSAVRSFRLHLRHRVFDGWVTADGQAVAIEDQEHGLTTAAATPDDLIRGYGDGHIEWLPPGTQHPAPPEQQGERR
ncbi:hypothetical protein [Streptomyces phaeochromogenes]|uniref:hypothetical protein n=1 Tax=Streptomyces phaeochromogenes TaxID=1923 RepID=UPI002DD96F5E|nr:hypothetical protein [Streptomyces phaeochromogenes]WRZ30208.1 hypothetical protein OG931_21885 [Streptomyces phaeochromogenes]